MHDDIIETLTLCFRTHVPIHCNSCVVCCVVLNTCTCTCMRFLSEFLSLICAFFSSPTARSSHCFAMASVKQLIFPTVIFVAILVTVQGELNRFCCCCCCCFCCCYDYEVVFWGAPIMQNQARMQFRGEVLFVWNATEHIHLHTLLDECRYTSPAGDTSVMILILLARKPMWSVTNRDTLELPHTPEHLLTCPCELV